MATTLERPRFRKTFRALPRSHAIALPPNVEFFNGIGPEADTSHGRLVATENKSAGTTPAESRASAVNSACGVALTRDRTDRDPVARQWWVRQRCSEQAARKSERQFRTALRHFFGASSFFIMPLSFFAMSAHIVSFCESFFIASFAAIAV